MSDRLVFVLGAGFTRAFVPRAPLLVDDYEIPRLRERFASFSHAAAILDDALAEYPDGRVNLERLMTRLSGMPYDAVDARRELALVETALRKSLVERLTEAKKDKVDWEKLKAFARLVRKDKASIVTFNYDDVLDEVLWKDTQTPIENQPPDPHAWHPDGGYGFYCRPSSVCVADSPMYMNETHSLVLKLHGSINWRSRLGEGTSRGPAGILHHEDWYKMPVRFHQPDYNRIESHLELDPFIVPPVLVKAELTTHPVLNVVWTLAHERLRAAETVVFIGYSLPETDLASRTLFRETLRHQAGRDMRIVDFARCDDDNKRVKDAYQSLFPDLPDANFDFAGASAWIERQPGYASIASEREGTV
jgi:hypothetical protein